MGFDLDNLADCAMCVLDTGLIVLVDFKIKRMKEEQKSSRLMVNSLQFARCMGATLLPEAEYKQHIIATC